MAHRVFAGERLVVASHNRGKLREIAALTDSLGLVTLSAGELGLPEPEETGKTFAENALIKAHAAAKRANLPALGDDSGLAVEALNGAPGIYSARWAGPRKDFAGAMDKIETMLADRRATGARDRKASFICALALAWPDGHVEVFEGSVAGRLVYPWRGRQGFGYDPMFQPEGHAQTFAEMAPEEKHEISHRARAFAKLMRQVFQGSRDVGTQARQA
ncbi:MAG: RdgB/HAM1 family non-canonical purine NTP pyrophosphatase [Hyphomicrobiales bacterium]